MSEVHATTAKVVLISVLDSAILTILVKMLCCLHSLGRQCRWQGRFIYQWSNTNDFIIANLVVLQHKNPPSMRWVLYQ